MIASRTFPSDRCGFDGRARGGCDDTWDADQFSDKLGCQVSEDAGVLVGVDLHLPAGYGVALTTRDGLMIVVVVYFLCSGLQNRNQSVRLVADKQAQVLIEVQQ